VYVVGLLAVAACTASAADVGPPDDQIFFPTGLAIAPDDSVMFVASSNSDLRFDSGTIDVIDLALVDSVTSAWLTSGTIPDKCNQDPDHSESLICDEAQFIKVGDGVRTGNFATSIAVQQLGSGSSDPLRLIVPTRGDPSITWANYAAGKLDCTTSQGFAICDDDHRLTNIRNDPDLGTISPEPFDAYVDSANQFAIVTHLETGDITLVDSPAGGSAVISDVQYDVFGADPLTGIEGTTAVSGRSPGSADDIVYVSSRSENRVQMVTVGRPVNNDFPFLILGNFFFESSVGVNAGNSEDTRSIMFSPDGNTMYLANRLPPTLQVYDTSPSSTGFPANQLRGVTDICQEVSTGVVLDSGDGPRIYLACFQDGEVYVVDPSGSVSQENIILAGRGPFSIAAAPTRQKVYVTNFLEDTIGVIDESPTSATRDRVVLRIGQPKAPDQTTQESGL
jgi:DNA-binding beta-propeller fold protein YncE